MNNNIQCSIESSTTKIELNSAVEGVFLAPELEGLAGLPEIRTTSGVNAGYDGGWTSAQNYDARLISIRGVIANPDVSKVEAKRRAIASLLGQGRKEQLTLRFTTEAGNSYVIYVRTISCEMALQRVLTTQEFLIQLRADDPLIYDDGASSGTEAILQVQKALGGFEIDFELPLAIGGGAEDTIVENGSETVYPIINLYGPLHSPTVVNRTTNQQMQILADLQYSISWSGYQTKDIGAYDQLDNELDGAPMYLSQLTGNAEQTTYSGKNLIRTRPSSGSQNGITWTLNQDGSVKVSGTATATQVIGFGSVSMEQGKTYTLSGCPSGGAVGKYMLYTNIIEPQFVDTGSGATQTVSANGGAQIYFIVYSGRTIDGTIYPQCELGSTATDYEPYVGGTASPNPSYPQPISTVTGEQTVRVTGKNLIDPSKLASYVLEGTISNHYYYDAKLWVELEAGKTYTISLNVDEVDVVPYVFTILLGRASAGQPTVEIKSINDLSTVGDRIEATFSVTQAQIDSAGGNMLFMRVPRYRTATTSHYKISNIMLEIGDSATSFEAYQAQDFPIDLGSIELAKIGTYQDRIYKNDGKWYIEKQVGKVVLDGTEAGWGLFSNNNAFYSRAYDAQKPSSTATAGAIMANYYTAESEVNIYNAGVDYGIGISSQNRFLIRNKDIATVANLKTWLGTNKPSVYYALATPTTTEITDETLLLQLNFLASLYEGENNISLVGTGAQGQIVVKYATAKTINQDVAVIDSQARTITLNGQDIYHLKSEESEFLLLAPGDNKLYLTSEVSDDSGYAEVKFKQGYLSI